MTVILIIGIILVAIWLFNRNQTSNKTDHAPSKNVSKKQPSKIKGRIEYFELENWWLSTFTETEREHIVKTFTPLSYGGKDDEDTLISGNISGIDDTAINLLSNLSGWFNKEADRTIGYRLIKKAEELITENSNVLDIHFLYQHKIELYYKFRGKDSFVLEEVINACKKQIEISGQAKLAFKKDYKGDPLPSHKGFELLTRLEEDTEKVLELAKRASKEGWYGDWKK